MKKVITAAILGGIFLSSGLSWAEGAASPAPSQGNRIEVPVEELLSPPSGFDDNDNVQVVLYGQLPNSCYTLDNYQVERMGNNELRVHQFAYKEEGGLCASESTLPDSMKMLVPFTMEISIGQLPAGDYKFDYETGHGGAGMRMLNVVRAAAPTVDSLPYAIVSESRVPDLVNGASDVIVELAGSLNSSCTALDNEVKVARFKDTIVLMPTIRTKPGVICTQILMPFSRPVNLGKLQPGRYLIHARSMNGKSVNRVVLVSR